MFASAEILRDAFDALRLAAAALAISVLAFGLIALLVKGREAFDAAARAVAEVRLNLAFYFFDAIFVAPVLTVMIVAIRSVIDVYSLISISSNLWDAVG